MTRRDWLLASAAPAVLHSQAKKTKISVAQTDIISQQPENYHGWPTLTRKRNGELLVVCSGGRESHVCPFGRVELMCSKDEGLTWSWPQIIMDSAIDDRDAGVCETPKGAIVVTTFTSLAYEDRLKKEGDKLAFWSTVNLRATPEQRQSLLGTWMLRSDDAGLTWSAPYRVPLNSPHGPIALSDGRLLYAGKKLWDSSQRVGVADSSDEGRTWNWLADIPTRMGDDVKNYHELHAVETADKRLIVQIRNHNRENDRETLQCESTDGGRSWTQPKPTGIWGLPSHLLRLKDGRLVMSYGYRRSPYGVQVSLSSDHGRTWGEPLTITEDGAGVDLGYPSTVELANGDLLTVWYELLAGSQRAVLRQARWSWA
ncbi:MAG: sialidase family protein [Bryobacteraceae bacterium]